MTRQRFTPRIIEGGGSLLLPRTVDVGRGDAMWPKCLVCKRSVDAYGIGEDTRHYIEFWARCDGISGLYGGKHARSYRAGIRIDKRLFPGGWTENSSKDVLCRLYIEPNKFAKWALTMGDPNTVRPV